MGRQRNYKKAFMTGLIGGVVASWAMNQYWTVTAKMKEKHASPSEREQLRKAQQQRELDNPTVKIAEMISEDLLGHHLDDHEKKLAGPIVHYAFGALMGAFYGVVAELVCTGFGTGYGAAVWLAADEIMLPALHLTEPSREYPLSVHLEGLGAHLVYGATLEAVRRPLHWIV
jgi:uncharacterized membrane protein YagU involved in acid resistance